MSFLFLECLIVVTVCASLNSRTMVTNVFEYSNVNSATKSTTAILRLHAILHLPLGICWSGIAIHLTAKRVWLTPFILAYNRLIAIADHDTSQSITADDGA